MAKAYLLLGTNVGNKEKNLATTIDQLNKISINKIIKSSLYNTSPWGNLNQPNFLNQALILDTTLNPEELLHFIQQTEILMGRERIIQWGPRTIDIDILFYDNKIVDNPNLIIPHPRVCSRKFALAPLAEIAPNLKHPIIRKQISQLLIDCKDELFVQIVK